MALNRWADTIHKTQDGSQHQIRACLHGGGGPQIGEVTRLGGVKINPPLHAILQPRHPGMHFRKIIEWSLSK